MSSILLLRSIAVFVVASNYCRLLWLKVYSASLGDIGLAAPLLEVTVRDVPLVVLMHSSTQACAGVSGLGFNQGGF